MSAEQYDFETQHKIGQAGESFLDRWLYPLYAVTDVSGDSSYQQAGIDRILTRPDGSVFTVEYKVDLAAKRTGNLFFETVSNDKKARPGWGWSSQADYWLILIPDQEILIFNPDNLRNLVQSLQRTLRQKSIPNRGYNTIGYPIPLCQAQKVAAQVMKLYISNL